MLQVALCEVAKGSRAGATGAPIISRRVLAPGDPRQDV